MAKFKNMLYILIDIVIRVTALAFVVYIVYCEIQVQFLALAFLALSIIGIKNINTFIEEFLFKFKYSVRGQLPGGFGDYDLGNNAKLRPTAPVSFGGITYKSDIDREKIEKYNKLIRNALESLKIKRWDIAAEYIEEALKIKSNIPLQIQLSIIYGEYIKNKEKAIKICKEILQVDPENISVNFNLAVYTNHLKGYKESLPIYLKTEKLMTKAGMAETELDGKLNIFIGHDFRDSGDLKEARIRYKKAIEILKKLADQGDRSSGFWLSDAQENLGKLSETTNLN